MTDINTGPLLAERAAIVIELLGELIYDNLGVTGFLLHGSYWDPASQFPAADIDINWTGQATEGTAGDGLRQWNHVHNGVHVELAPYFWGDLTKPATLSLPTIVSLVRGHVLWERAGTLSVPQATARQLLHAPAWVTEKVEAGIAAVRKFRDDWCKPETVVAPIKGDWDFVRLISLHLGGFLSAVDLRPPSAARKGFMGIMETARALELPELERAIFYAAGMDNFTHAEIDGWCERVEAACQCVAERQPDAALSSLRYYTVGAREIVRRGFGPAALWPLWRAARRCANQLPDEALTRDCFAELGRRLRVLRVEDILAKAARLTPVIDLLEQHREGLIQHVLRRRVS